jgi:type IV pilus assembly protein PilN
MIRINLLPVRQTRKIEAARRELVLALAGGGVVLVCAAAAWAFFYLQLSSLKEGNIRLQNEIDQLAADVKMVDELEKFKAELQRKLSVIDDLRAQKTGPVHMLDDLSTATPDKLQLTLLDTTGSDLKLEGVSVGNDQISQFLRQLDASPYFEQVYLQDIEQTTPDKNTGATYKSFKLTAKLVSPKSGAATDAAASGDTKAAGDGSAPAGKDAAGTKDGAAAPAKDAATPAPSGTTAPAAGAAPAAATTPAAPAGGAK